MRKIYKDIPKNRLLAIFRNIKQIKETNANNDINFTANLNSDFREIVCIDDEAMDKIYNEMRTNEALKESDLIDLFEELESQAEERIMKEREISFKNRLEWLSKSEDEDDKVKYEYLMMFGDCELIGRFVPCGYPSGVEERGGPINVYKECIEKGVKWEELLNYINIWKLNPSVII